MFSKYHHFNSNYHHGQVPITACSKIITLLLLFFFRNYQLKTIVGQDYKFWINDVVKQHCEEQCNQYNNTLHDSRLPLQCKRDPLFKGHDDWPLKIGATGCLETLVTKNHSTPRNIPEEWISCNHVLFKWANFWTGRNEQLQEKMHIEIHRGFTIFFYGVLLMFSVTETMALTDEWMSMEHWRNYT